MYKQLKSMRLLTTLIIITAARFEAYANNHILKPYGLTTSSMKIMFLLHAKAALSPTELLNMIGGTKSNITQRLDFLEKNKYIKRLVPRDNPDKRKILVKLTPAGRKAFLEGNKRIIEESRRLEAKFSKKEINAQIKFFMKTNRIIDEHTGTKCQL